MQTDRIHTAEPEYTFLLPLHKAITLCHTLSLTPVFFFSGPHSHPHNLVVPISFLLRWTAARQPVIFHTLLFIFAFQHPVSPFSQHAVQSILGVYQNKLRGISIFGTSSFVGSLSVCRALVRACFCARDSKLFSRILKPRETFPRNLVYISPLNKHA